MPKLPKPIFVACDETSLRLKTDIYSVDSGNLLYLEYKLPIPSIEWSSANKVQVKNNNSVLLADLVDLEPGTAYQVRFRLQSAGGQLIEVGPDTVYDTKPIDCGPKGKSCIIQ